MRRFRIAVALVAALLFVTGAVLSGCGEPTGEVEKKIPEPLYKDDEPIQSTREDGVKMFTDGFGNKILALASAGDFNIAPDTEQDVSRSIQAALNIVGNKGGGILFLPKGKYILDNALTVPANTCLMGEWAKPTENTISGGTILIINFDMGKDSESADDAAIKLNHAAAVKNITICYSMQSESSPVPYPYTIANKSYYNATVENVTIVNAYRGIKIDTHNCGSIRNVYITAFENAVFVNHILDITYVMDVHVGPEYLKMYIPEKSLDAIKAGMREGLRAFVFGRYDWIYMDNCTADSGKIGIELYQDEKGSTNGQFYRCEVTNSKYGILLNMNNAIGLQFTSCSFSATDTALVSTELNTSTSTMFNDCRFESDGKIFRNDGRGVSSFTNCAFERWDDSDYGMVLNGGSYIFDGCTFADYDKDIYIHCSGDGVGVSTVKISGCTFEGGYQVYNGLVEKGYSRRFAKDDNPSFVEKKSGSIAMGEAKEEKAPPKDDIFYASDYGAVADANLFQISGTDNTKAIQHALNVAGKNGGGYVVLDSGVYYVKDYLVIPENVVLVGNHVAQKHFAASAKGTVLITDNGSGGSGNPFVTLSNNAGIENLTIFYPRQVYNNPVKYTHTIHLAGNGSFVYRVTMPDSYKLLLITGDNCHVKGTRGMGIESCIVAEKAKNLQFDFVMITGGDWQDNMQGSNENVPPPSDHWKKHPNFENSAIILNDCNDVFFYQCFSFGMGQGLTINGKTDKVFALGLGIDASRDAIVLDTSGKELYFINTELVGLDSNIRTKGKFTGEAYFYNTNCWFGSNVDSVFDGPGTVYIQQYKIMKGGFKVNGGTVRIQNAIFDGSGVHVKAEESAKGGIVNSVGTAAAFVSEISSQDFTVRNCTNR